MGVISLKNHINSIAYMHFILHRWKINIDLGYKIYILHRCVINEDDRK